MIDVGTMSTLRNEEAIGSRIMDSAHDIADHRNRHLGIMNTLGGPRFPGQDLLDSVAELASLVPLRTQTLTTRARCPPPMPVPIHIGIIPCRAYKQMDDEHKPLFLASEELTHD